MIKNSNKENEKWIGMLESRNNSEAANNQQKGFLLQAK